MHHCRLPSILLVIGAAVTLTGTAAGSSGSIKDSVELVKTIPGQDNIVISVPHGGYLSPSTMTPREDGCRVDGKCVYQRGCKPKSTRCRIVPRRDIHALEIGQALVQQLQARGRKPHVVYMLVHRQFIDANRSPEQACEGSAACLKAYDTFHGFIRAARRKIVGPGLYIDVHTIRHVANWTELGYRISKQDLNRTGPLGDLPSSIDQLRKRTGVSLEELVRGNRSLGNLLSYRGHMIIPSPIYPRPGLKGYARGGFNTVEYGSMNGGCIDGIQVEGSLLLRLGTTENARQFGRILADAVLAFMRDFGYDDPKTVCVGASRIQPLAAVVGSCLTLILIAMS